MNIQTRKLNLIDRLIHLNDDQKISEIEQIVFSYDNSQNRTSQLKGEDLIYRAQLSEEQYKKGGIIDQDQLENESENW